MWRAVRAPCATWCAVCVAEWVACSCSIVPPLCMTMHPTQPIPDAACPAGWVEGGAGGPAPLGASKLDLGEWGRLDQLLRWFRWVLLFRACCCRCCRHGRGHRRRFRWCCSHACGLRNDTRLLRLPCWRDWMCNLPCGHACMCNPPAGSHAHASRCLSLAARGLQLTLRPSWSSLQGLPRLSVPACMGGCCGWSAGAGADDCEKRCTC